MGPLQKQVTIMLLGLILFSSLGCAQKDHQVTGSGPGLRVTSERGDPLDRLLEEDFPIESSGLDEDYGDPLEPMNRIFFVINDKLYDWLLAPLNTAYSAVLPGDVRSSIGKFTDNLSAPVRFINNLLQGKISSAAVVFSRFLINSTLGVYGLADPAAAEFGLEPRPADFGQTLALLGVGEGAYLFLPLLGPTTVRDGLSFVGDAALHPIVWYVDDLSVSFGYYSVYKVNQLSLHPGYYEDIKTYAVDPYSSIRQLYLDLRREAIEGASGEGPR